MKNEKPKKSSKMKFTSYVACVNCIPLATKVKNDTIKESDAYYKELLGELKEVYLEGNAHDFGFSVTMLENAINSIAKELGWDK